MIAARLSAYGADPVLVEVPEPAIAQDEVLVRVAGAALNPLDVKSVKRSLAGGRATG